MNPSPPPLHTDTTSRRAVTRNEDENLVRLGLIQMVEAGAIPGLLGQLYDAGGGVIGPPPYSGPPPPASIGRQKRIAPPRNGLSSPPLIRSSGT